MKINNFKIFFGFIVFLLFIPSISIKGSEIKNNFLISENQKDDEGNIETVVSTGSGVTIQAAIQDASVNALKIVSGTFIDEKTSYENRYSSKNDLTNETEIFKEKIRSNSQGSIESYEVLSTKKEGSNYKVKVTFDIRREEFKTYVKEEGTGSKKIKKGLFATIASENKESDSKIGFLKKIVTPLNDAEVIDISVGEPISVKSFISPSKKGEETVKAKGFGETIDNAVKNAAFNALTQVVGSFMDAESYFKYQEEITNAIVKQSESFSYDVQEYSKGSITLFEIIENSKSDGIYKITANVTVGLENFKTYLNELLAFGSNVGSYSDSLCMRTFGYDDVCNKDFSFFTEKKLFPDKTILIPFEISLRDGYLENTEKILGKVSSEKITIDPSPFSYYNFSDFDPSQDHIISIIDLSGKKPNIRKYLLNEAKATLHKLKGGSSKKKSKDEVLLYGISCRTKGLSEVNNKTLEIRFLDGYGNTIQKINPSCISSSSKGTYNIFESPTKNLHNNQITETPWMSLYTRTDECLDNTNSRDFELCETQIITKRYYWLAFQVENFEMFNELSKIEITYVDYLKK